MTRRQAWHWQERFEPVDVEDACRRQSLKIHKSMSYQHWLKQKARTVKSIDTNETSCTEEVDEQKKEEVDAAFQMWLRQKRKQHRAERKQQQEQQSEKDKPKSKWCGKPPSLHVNPKTKGCCRKAEPTAASLVTSSSAPILPNKHNRPAAETQQAYEAWLARVRQEDQVRRHQRRQDMIKLEKQQREKHKLTWRKKLAVCAYSTTVQGYNSLCP